MCKKRGMAATKLTFGATAVGAIGAMFWFLGGDSEQARLKVKPNTQLRLHLSNLCSAYNALNERQGSVARTRALDKELNLLEHWAAIARHPRQKIDEKDLNCVQEIANNISKIVRDTTRIRGGSEDAPCSIILDIDRHRASVSRELSRYVKAIEGRLKNKLTRQWSTVENRL